jgi:hypothetical protein
MLQAVPFLEPLQPTPEIVRSPQNPPGLAPTTVNPTPNTPTPNTPTPVTPTNRPDALLEQRVAVPGRVEVQTESTTVVPNSGQGLTPGVGSTPLAVESGNTGPQPGANSQTTPERTQPELSVTPPQPNATNNRETTPPQPNATSNTETTTPQPNLANNSNTATPNANRQAPTPGAGSQVGNPLLIPDAALNSGSTRFLEGSWSAGTGIQDAATGKPVRLEYDFSQGNGQGRVTVRRGDGVQCTGAVGAQVQGRTVQINDRGVAQCTDGSTMALPKVTCTPGAGNQAACQGQYDNGTSFPVSMRHAPK